MRVALLVFFLSVVLGATVRNTATPEDPGSTPPGPSGPSGTTSLTLPPTISTESTTTPLATEITVAAATTTQTGTAGSGTASPSSSYFPPGEDVVIDGDAFVRGNATIAVQSLQVSGKLTVQGGLVVVPNARPSVQAMDISGIFASASSSVTAVQGLLNISAFARLLVIIDTPPPSERTNVSVAVLTYAQREGTFRNVLLEASDPCTRAQNPSPTYSPSALSVTVQVESSCNGGGLSTGAIIGIAVGAGVVGVLVVVAIVLITIRMRRKHTEQGNRMLAQKDAEQIRMGDV